MKKKIYKTIFISLLIIIAINIKSYGASDFSYTLDINGKATITAYKGSASDLIIPSKIDEHDVVAIGRHAFNESKNSTNGHTIKNLIISEGIERIELLAFAKCINLETVQLPESLTYIDMQVFIQCSKLKLINIPSKIEKIANCTFQETGIVEFCIPENVKHIDSRALGICPRLEKVIVYSKDVNYVPGVFEMSSSNLILYGYEGSTTQIYAQQNGIKFETLSSIETPNIIKPGSIQLNKNKLFLKEGESENLIVSFIEMPSTKVIWHSSDEKIVTVENGKVVAKEPGNTVITVSTENGQYEDKCNVSIIKKEEILEPTIVDMTLITLNKSSLYLNIGDIENLLITILPNNVTNKDVKWSSSDEKVVTVENGKIIAKGVGTAIITVSNLDNTQSAICNVTVINNEIISAQSQQIKINMLLVIIIVSSIVVLIIIIMYKKKISKKNKKV